MLEIPKQRADDGHADTRETDTGDRARTRIHGEDSDGRRETRMGGGRDTRTGNGRDDSDGWREKDSDGWREIGWVAGERLG